MKNCADQFYRVFVTGMDNSYSIKIQSVKGLSACKISITVRIVKI